MGSNMAFTVCMIICLMWGAAAFWLKILTFFTILVDDTIDPVHAIFYFFMFANQCMNIVPVRELLMDRVIVAIFGGPDAHVSAEEYYVMKMYMAVLMEKI